MFWRFFYISANKFLFCVFFGDRVEWLSRASWYQEFLLFEQEEEITIPLFYGKKYCSNKRVNDKLWVHLEDILQWILLRIGWAIMTNLVYFFLVMLQISEVVNSMKDLIDYSRETGTGPMGKIIVYWLICHSSFKKGYCVRWKSLMHWVSLFTFLCYNYKLILNIILFMTLSYMHFYW